MGCFADMMIFPRKLAECYHDELKALFQARIWTHHARSKIWSRAMLATLLARWHDRLLVCIIKDVP